MQLSHTRSELDNRTTADEPASETVMSHCPRLMEAEGPHQAFSGYRAAAVLFAGAFRVAADLAVVLRTVVFFAAAFLAGAFVEVFRAAVLATTLLLAAFLAGAFLAAVFLAGAFFAAVFLAEDFFTAVFDILRRSLALGLLALACLARAPPRATCSLRERSRSGALPLFLLLLFGLQLPCSCSPLPGTGSNPGQHLESFLSPDSAIAPSRLHLFFLRLRFCTESCAYFASQLDHLHRCGNVQTRAATSRSS